jgi:CelD/BcsL family acetyltransferase involved in cellulose biosynthesis
MSALALDPPAEAGPLTVACLESRADLDRLESEWDTLLAASDVASPFLTPGWHRAWLDSYGRGRRLWVLAARRGPSLVGLWPLTIIRRGIFNVLLPVGAGRSDWLDVITSASHRREVLRCFLQYLIEHRRAWDLLECRDVLDTSPSIEAFESLCGMLGLHAHREVRTVAPQLHLAANWDSFLATKRPKFRSNLKYERRVAERECPKFAITLHRWQSVDDVVDRLAEVELHSWKARFGNLKISTSAGREFYRCFCRYFADRGELDLWRADYEGGLIAFLVNIRHGGKIYHYNTCFDERHGRLSPGMLLHSEAIQDAFRRRLSEYDFLSGDEPYKDRWCTSKRAIHHLAFHNGRLRSRAAFLGLVWARWAFRKSKTLRAGREKVLTLTRRLERRAELQGGDL